MCVGLVAPGCVDGFQGSNVEIDLAAATPAQAGYGSTPRVGQLPTNAHFTLYGIQTADDRDRLFPLNTFEIHPIVDLASPCFIDTGEHERFPGLHVSQYAAKLAEVTGITDYRNPPADASEGDKIDAATAAQRMLNITALGGDGGIKAVTSASYTLYPAMATDCTGSESLIPPPKCTDDVSNARRDSLCKKAWHDDPSLWEGTDRVLTAPLAGTTFGLVDGMNPINLAPVGGAGLFIDEAVSTMDAFAIFYQTDGQDDPGNLLLYGLPTTPTRGITHVHLTSVTNPNLTADMAIFADLGKDDVHF